MVIGQEKVDSLHIFEQIADITEGNFLKVHQEFMVLATLCASVLPSKEIRFCMRVCTNDTVDLRANCACHNKPADAGYLCPTCLAVFCSFIPVCKFCKTKFEFETAPLLAKIPNS